MTELVVMGRIEGGKLKLRNRRKFDDTLSHWKDGEIVCTIEKAHATRSLEQNSLYWVGYVKPLAEYTGYTAKEMHAYLKKRFLPAKPVEIVNRRTGEVVDRAEIDALTTTTLNKVEFGDYLREIEVLALDLNVTVGSSCEDAA